MLISGEKCFFVRENDVFLENAVLKITLFSKNLLQKMFFVKLKILEFFNILMNGFWIIGLVNIIRS
jgi:hypothetical protein